MCAHLLSPLAIDIIKCITGSGESLRKLVSLQTREKEKVWMRCAPHVQYDTQRRREVMAKWL
jgi:hypothetical protein